MGDRSVTNPTAETDAKALTRRALDSVGELKSHVTSLESEIHAMIEELLRYQSIDIDEIKKFLREPWCIVPKGRDEYWVIVPRWVGLSVGWLERTTETYNVFSINRYSHWFGAVPDELREKLKTPEPFEATVEDGKLKTSAVIAEKFKDHLWGQLAEGEYRIRKGHEFDIIASIVEAGALPFKPRPVHPEDLRDPTLSGVLSELRPYQIEAWERFKQYGAIGVYLPWGTGKTVIGMYLIARLKGRKLVVCPTNTLVEQWQKRLRQWLTPDLSFDVEVVTYHAWEKVKDRDWSLVIYEESHRLPSNQFSRLASLRTKYRIGLSATPHREDGREHYIIALTGYPVGMDWSQFVRSGLVRPPKVQVQIVDGWREKVRAAEAELRDVDGATIIFCDSIQKGKQLASRFSCPHVWGDTKNRIDTLESAAVAVVSRVGDEGVSLPKLRKIIEIDFHGASRRQEGQRVGRLLHADGVGSHLVLMTREEFDKFEGRFLALEEKGFKIQVKEER